MKKVNILSILSVLLILSLSSCDIGAYYSLYPTHQLEKQTNLDNVNTILAIGDSISYGAGAKNGYGFIHMFRDSSAIKSRNIKVINCSHCAYHTDEGFEMIDECEESFDMLIIHLGMNDTYFYDKNQYKQNMKAIIEYARVRNENCKIVLMSTLLPKTYWKTTYMLARLYQYEDALYELKDEYENISVVPICSYSICKIQDGCSPIIYIADDVHPNTKMHQEMMSLLLYTITD